MSKTAEERANATWDDWVRQNDRTHKPVGVGGFELLTPTEIMLFRQCVADALVAHANAALERAAVEADGRTLSSENCRTDGGCSHIQCLVAREIATAIRALREEGSP